MYVSQSNLWFIGGYWHAFFGIRVTQRLLKISLIVDNSFVSTWLNSSHLRRENPNWNKHPHQLDLWASPWDTCLMECDMRIVSSSSCFDHGIYHSNGNPNWDKNWCHQMGYCYGRTDHAILGESCRRHLELWVRKAIRCSELSGLLKKHGEPGVSGTYL